MRSPGFYWTLWVAHPSVEPKPEVAEWILQTSLSLGGYWNRTGDDGDWDERYLLAVLEGPLEPLETVQGLEFWR